MAHSVVFAPEAESDLVELYDYLARHGGLDRARRYVQRIVATYRILATFPERGTRRDDIRPGLRLTSHARPCARRAGAGRRRVHPRWHPTPPRQASRGASAL